jgi:hypothetical protein
VSNKPKRRPGLNPSTKKALRESRAAKPLAELADPVAVHAIQDAARAFANEIPTDGSLGPFAASVLPASLLLQAAHALQGVKGDAVGNLEIDGRSIPVRVADMHAAGMGMFARAMSGVLAPLVAGRVDDFAAGRVSRPRIFAMYADEPIPPAPSAPSTPPAAGGKPGKQRRGRGHGTKKRGGRVK